jgi:hypothetical protein
MATSHKRRFERWRKSLDSRTAFLVDQVFEVLLRPLLAQGFEWADRIEEFGAIADSRADSIALQRRSGAAWPTVVISFNHRGKACFRIDFTELPEVCHQLTEHGLVEIPRHQARVFNGPCHLMVVRGERRSNDGEFGCCPWPKLTDLHRVDRLLRLRFAPEGLLRQEVGLARECMSEILEFSVSGLPLDWETAPLGRIGRHMYLLSSHHWARTHRSTSITARAAAATPQDTKDDDDDYAKSVIDIATDPVLSAIDTDLKTTRRHAMLLRNMLLAGAVAMGVGYLLMQPRLEPVRVTMVLLLFGAFPAQLVFWAWASRRVAARHGLVCRSCGETPPAPEVMSTAIKLRCPRCSAKMSNAIP